MIARTGVFSVFDGIQAMTSSVTLLQILEPAEANERSPLVMRLDG